MRRRIRDCRLFVRLFFVDFLFDGMILNCCPLLSCSTTHEISWSIKVLKGTWFERYDWSVLKAFKTNLIDWFICQPPLTVVEASV